MAAPKMSLFVLAATVLNARSTQEGEAAFALLCMENLEVAEHLAAVLVAAIPESDSLWQKPLELARSTQQDAKDAAQRQSGPPMAKGDDVDTAAGLAARLGWRDMEVST